MEIFDNLFFISSDFGFRELKITPPPFFVNNLTLGYASVDQHIFADPDPGSQNDADLMDANPDPKHCL